MGRMLMLALPHHLPLLGNATHTVVGGGGHRTIRGFAPGVLTTGNKWVMLLPSNGADWLATPDLSYQKAIAKALRGTGKAGDAHYDFGPEGARGAVDPLRAGRMAAKMATLSQIANTVGEPKIATALLEKLIRRLSAWFDGTPTGANHLVYDSAWGGIVTCGFDPAENQAPPVAGVSRNATCPAANDTDLDLGNAGYESHHHHYGNLIFAAAVVAQADPQWAAQYGPKVLALIRDVANPSPADPFFPTFRHFDWYLGLSSGSGLAADAARNETSTAEAIHTWYAIHLYGRATNNEQLKNLGSALMAAEAHSLHHYVHVRNGTGVYHKEYNHSVVGVIGEEFVQLAGPDGSKEFATFGRQLTPLSPVTPSLFHAEWVVGGWRRFEKTCTEDPDCRGSGFVAFLLAHQALIDRRKAWRAATALPPSMFANEGPAGSGLTHAALLHFIATYGRDEPEPVIAAAQLAAEAPHGGSHHHTLSTAVLLLTFLASSSSAAVLLAHALPRPLTDLLCRLLGSARSSDGPPPSHAPLYGAA
eukprot:TRINITY_DN12543_c0_g1_i1.p1 TRINITY_DN12543_c0_g1~~TRINITY_DN12543_c0_g1_i1.p1  ORF type:complete len:532 (+),score=156.45 TRINITY_DN12543_c0_g1_i1:77-1672(+)